MGESSLAGDFPTAQLLHFLISPCLQAMDLSSPALTSLFGAAIWHFKAVDLSGHLTWNITRSVPQVACSRNWDSINQARGNLRRGSCHLGSRQWKKEQLLRSGHVSAHWWPKNCSLGSDWMSRTSLFPSCLLHSTHSSTESLHVPTDSTHSERGKNRVTAHCSPMAHPAPCLLQRMGWDCKRQLGDVKNLGKKTVYTHILLRQ